jgi:glycosyltransferase involved in cell wall biosynthesis
MKKINVLHLYQNSQVGGIQLQLLSLFNAYDRDVLVPLFCCLGPRLAIVPEMETLGIEVIALNRLRYNRMSPGIIRDLYRVMKDRGIHVLRTHKYRSNFYGRVAAFLAGVPVVIASEHNTYQHKEMRVTRRVVNKALSLVSDRIVAVSDAIRKDIVRYDRVAPSKVIVIRNGVDTAKFEADGSYRDVRKEFGIGTDGFLIGFIGRLVANKSLPNLMRAFSMLRAKAWPVTLLMVGEGSMMGELKRMAREDGVADSVVFTGIRRDIPDILSALDVFVLPSVNEGLPNALLEAMAMGKAVVASDVAGVPEVVEPGVSGLLVPPEDHMALEKALSRLFEDRGLAARLGRAARETVEKEYSIEATAVTWRALYLSLLEQKGVCP